MRLLRLSLFYLLLTGLSVYFATYVHIALIYVDTLFVFVNDVLIYYFPNGWLAETITQLVLSFGLVSIPGGIYWLLKRQQMPYFLEITWVLWIIFYCSNVLIH